MSASRNTVLKLILDLEAKKALKGLGATSDAAGDAADAFDDLGKASGKTGKGLQGFGAQASKMADQVDDASKKVDNLKDGMGESSSIASALGGAVGRIAPEAEAGFMAVADLTGGLEGLLKGGLAAIGPIAAIGAAVALATAAWTHFNEKQEKAQEEMRRTAEEAKRLETVMGQINLQQAEDQIALLAAQGKVNNREVAEYNAHKQAAARHEEVHNKAIEKAKEAQQKLKDAVQEETDARAALAAAKKTISTSDITDAAKRLDAALKETRAAEGLEATFSKQLHTVQAAITKDADVLMQTFDALQKAQETAVKSGGGRSALDEVLAEADRLSAPVTTKLQDLNAVLATLQGTTTKGSKQAAALAQRIAEVTAARDAEQEKVNAAAADKQAKALQASSNQMQALTGAMDSFTASFMPAQTELERTTQKQSDFAASFEKIRAAAVKAGTDGTASFAEMEKEFARKMDLIQKRINELSATTVEKEIPSAIARGFGRATAPLRDAGGLLVRGVKGAIGVLTGFIPEQFKGQVRNEFEKLGKSLTNIFSGGQGGIAGMVQTVQTGGASMVTGLVGQAAGNAAANKAAAAGADAAGQAAAAAGAAGPAGAAAGAALQIGMGGAQAFEQAKAERAAEIAANRQSKKQQQRDQMLSQGFSEEQVAQAGLSQEDVAKAGEVTKEDEKKAAQQVDRGEEMGKFVEGMVMGVVEGIKSLIVGLPNILEELIPILLTEFPVAIITSLFKMIPKMLKMLFSGLPKALFKGFVRGFKAIWKAIKNFFADIFSFGFQTGGYVPKDGRYILHQGERVVPATGAGTGTASAGLQAFTGSGGSNITVNTAVVDPDTVPALSRIFQSQVGSFGRTNTQFFGQKSPVESI